MTNLQNTYSNRLTEQGEALGRLKQEAKQQAMLFE